MLSILTRAIRTSLHMAGLEIRRTPAGDTALYHRIYGPEAVAERRFYNVGAGSFFHPCWTNIDYISDWYGNVQKNVVHHDLMSGEPLPAENAEVIYTSHTIEHVKDDAVARLFRNAYRALKPGGIFRVTTGPDADLDFAALQRGDAYWFYWDNDYSLPGTYEHMYHHPANTAPLEERWLRHVATQLAPNDKSPSAVKYDAAQIREIIDRMGFPACLDHFASLCEFQPERPGNHVSWWSGDKIISYLREAGFTDIYRSGYGQSRSPVLRNVRYFDNTHPQMSVYVEAVR